MSGHKRATVSARAENIRELSQTEMAVRFIEAGLKDLSQQLEHAAQTERDLERYQTETHNQQLIQALSEVDEAFSHLEEDTQKAISQQEEAYNQQLSQFGEYIEQTSSHQISELHEHYQTALDELAEQHEQSLASLSEQLDNILHEQNSLDLSVEKWIDAASAVLDSIAQTSAGFYARELPYYAQMINQALENQGAGYKEAALISAQNAYRELSQGKVRLDQLRHQYSALSRLLGKKLHLLEREIELNQQVHVLDLQGNPLESQIWVDDWVDGKLSQLQQEVRSALVWLEKPPSRARLKQMRSLIKYSLPRWQAALSEFVYQARSEVINSQLRMNTALMVVRTLETQGYKLERSTYVDGDMRSNYRAQLTDSEGSRVLVQVEPQEGSLETMQLNLFTQDADKRTPHELKQRAIEIQRSLRRAGLNIGDLTPVAPTQPYPERKHVKPTYQVKQETAIQRHDES